MTIILSLIVLFLLVSYGFVLSRQRSENKLWNRSFKRALIAVIIVGIIIHGYVLTKIGGGSNWLTTFLMSIVCTAEMFVGSTKIFDNGFHEFLFQKDNACNGELPTICLIIMAGVYAAAILSSIYVVLYFFFERSRSKSWLKDKKNQPKEDESIHVFFGWNDNAKQLVADIFARIQKDKILVIDYPQKEEYDLDASVWTKLLNALKTRDLETVKGATVLKSKNTLSNSNPSDLYASLGLDLQKWMTASSTVYLLSDDEKANRLDLRVLLLAIQSNEHGKVECDKVFCHGRRTELDKETEYAHLHSKENSTSCLFPEIEIIDSSQLSVRSLLRPKDSHTQNEKSPLPVDYVHVACDENGNKLGYVDSDFHSVIFGLGETGVEVLKFLYEYGSFPNKDGKKNTFTCKVFDKNLPEQQSLFYDELQWADKTKGIQFFDMDINTRSCWDEFENDIEQTNYIVICLGDDKLNLEVANSILTHHLKGKDTASNFIILIKQSGWNSYHAQTIHSLNEKNNHCIRTFGSPKDIWRLDVISDQSLKEDAIQYYITYNKANSYSPDFVLKEAPKWDVEAEKWDGFLWCATPEQRHTVNLDWNTYINGLSEEELTESNQKWSKFLRDKWAVRDSSIRKGERKDRTRSLRQRTQDFSNVLHRETKYRLLPQSILNDSKNIAEKIPGVFFGTFYEGSDPAVESALKYLAICEHLRWNASHQILGYVPGAETDDLRKTHKYLKEYSDLDPEIQHYDWLVVRVTLDEYRGQKDHQ